MAQDKNWAVKYVLDPLTAPAPSDETGPGSNHVSTSKGRKALDPSRSKSLSSASPRTPTDTGRYTGYPTPPSSASPSRTRFSYHQSPGRGEELDLPSGSLSSDARPRQQLPAKATVDSSGLRRGGSLTSRFPGDVSHKPLETLKRENKMAHRSPHLRKGHIPGPDTIDNLDNIMGTYHHEGPYDAALWARNASVKNSPLEAVRSSNEEALKATPAGKIRDSVQGHRPLDGVAVVPPGMRDLSGQVMDYEEGTDMMIENGGNYKRWPGVEYSPDDLKGRGEPSYSIEKALKEAKLRDHRRVLSGADPAIEMTATGRPSSAGHERSGNLTGTGAPYAEWQGGVRRSNTTGRSIGHGLKKRFGSLRRKERG